MSKSCRLCSGGPSFCEGSSHVKSKTVWLQGGYRLQTCFHNTYIDTLNKTRHTAQAWCGPSFKVCGAHCISPTLFWSPKRQIQINNACWCSILQSWLDTTLRHHWHIMTIMMYHKYYDMMSCHDDLSIFQNHIHTSRIHPSSNFWAVASVQVPSSLFTTNLQVWGRVLWSNATKNATKMFLSARWDLLPNADVWNDQLWPYGSTTATSTGFLTPIAGCTTIATHGNVHDNFPENK